MDTLRRFGIEEEYLLGRIDGLGPALLASELLGGAGLKGEVFAFQIEFISTPCSNSNQLLTEVLAARSAILDAVQEIGCTVFGAGFHPVTTRGEPGYLEASRSYLEPLRVFGPALSDHHSAGVHVHVEVADVEERLRAISACRVWLPLLLATAANSPFAWAQRVGVASYRHFSYRHLPTYGAPPANLDTQGLEAVQQTLARAGLQGDSSQIYWMIRPSLKFPTVEFRVFDGAPEAADALAYALLCRGLVDWALSGSDSVKVGDLQLELEMHKAATWGLDARLYHPINGGDGLAAEHLIALSHDLKRYLDDSESRFLERWVHERLESSRRLLSSSSAAIYMGELADAFGAMATSLAQLR